MGEAKKWGNKIQEFQARWSTKNRQSINCLHTKILKSFENESEKTGDWYE